MATDHPAREAHATEAAARGSDDADVRVTVVVPVWRPGEAIDPLIASLDAQTLAADRFELLLCDDGSGPETEERLRAIAAARPNVRVLALPHSGWPGTPRNRGVEEARGRYVQFVDQDDHLFPEALERLVDYADEHGADVVVGKEVGIGRDIPGRIFRRDVPDARLGRDPLLQMLTPHKMFRTAFLREHGIRFPDGKVRLEDHLFVMQAYFAARRISILASTPCYAWLRQPGSASSSRIEPESYFPHLETVLDVVEANTEAGELRDGLLRHWLRGKILQRLSGRQMTRYPDEYRERLLDVVTPLVERRFGPGVDAGLAYPHRLRVALLREGRRDDLLALARFEQAIGAAATIERAAWTRGGGLALRLRLRLDGEEAWTGPAWLDALHARVTGEPLDDRLEVLARHHDDPATDVRVASGRIDDAGVAQVAIDPLRVFAADDEARSVRLLVRAHRAGWPLEATLAAPAAVLAAAPASPLLAGRRVRLEQDDAGHVVLHRRWPEGRMRDVAGRVARRVRRRLRRGA